MAAVPQDLRRSDDPVREPGGADEFVLGEPASRLELIYGSLVSIFDLVRRDRAEDRPPVALTLAKLVAWVTAGIAITSGVVIGLGVVVVRTALGAFG